MVSFTGNYMIYAKERVASGECAGDLVQVIFIPIADDQAACSSPSGANFNTIDAAFLRVEGKCASVCNLVSGYYRTKYSVNNNGTIY